VGFIAQEVREALPANVSGTLVSEVDAAGHLGVEYSKLTAVLVGAVQEQQQTIAQHEQTIAQHEHDMQELRSQHQQTNAQHEQDMQELQSQHQQTNAQHEQDMQELRSQLAQLQGIVGELVARSVAEG
jgi:septal ring factor EnvC (AmiA/AmiB activator)